MNEQDLMSLKKRLILLVSQCLCYVLHLSYRYRIVHSENRQQAEGMHPKQAFAIASWHQNCFAGILSHAGQGLALLVSRSFDGEIVSGIAGMLGLRTVRGSSRKGGREALEVLIERTKKEGMRSALTVDGPKGPLYEVKRGIFQLSAQAGIPILPLLTIGDRYWVLHRSWDKFRIPKPFARVTIVYGIPFIVSPEEYADRLPELTQRLKMELMRLETLAYKKGLAPQTTSPLQVT